MLVSHAPFCLGMKLGENFNQFLKLHVYLLFKSIVVVVVLLGNHLTDGRGSKIMYLIFIVRGKAQSKSHGFIQGLLVKKEQKLHINSLLKE